MELLTTSEPTKLYLIEGINLNPRMIYKSNSIATGQSHVLLLTIDPQEGTQYMRSVYNQLLRAPSVSVNAFLAITCPACVLFLQNVREGSATLSAS